MISVEMIFGSFVEGIEGLIYSWEKKHLRWKWSFPKKLEIIFFWEMVPNLPLSYVTHGLISANWKWNYV